MPRIGNKPSGGSTPDAPDTTWPSNAPADPVQTPLDFLLAIMRNPEIPRSEHERLAEFSQRVVELHNAGAPGVTLTDSE